MLNVVNSLFIFPFQTQEGSVSKLLFNKMMCPSLNTVHGHYMSITQPEIFL